MRPDGTATYGGGTSLRTANTGITNEEYVDTMFSQILMREPAPAERANHIASLGGGMDRGVLFDTFLALAEYQDNRALMIARLGTILDSDFAILIDENGRSTQIGASDRVCSAIVTSNCFLPMTRTIRITNLGADSMKVESIVRWADRSSTGLHDVMLTMTLTNWKQDL
ncbi:MAG TPA: hypothetical protein PK765_05670 [bacterium]|mgnify:CR=1 FL=1|nr:hypothetical protein [bacterium]